MALMGVTVHHLPNITPWGESISIEEQEEINVVPTRLATKCGLALDPRTPDGSDTLGKG